MIERIKKLLDNVRNPDTGQTLGEEKRWLEVSLADGKLQALYQRDGISPTQKREIESAIVQVLDGLLSPDQILIKTTSGQSGDVFRAAAASASAPQGKTDTNPAQIKTGHGTVGNKRAIPGVGKVIAIGSGKGGVGKSTFTTNLALSLAKQGYRVGIIDADIYGPSLPMILGKRQEKPRSNSERKIIPVEAFGIKFMSFGFFIEEKDPVIWRGPMLGGVINQFFFDVDWQGTDYLLIDLPPGTGDIQLSMVQNAEVDGAIIISTPQDIALLDAKKGLEMFKKLSLPIVGMVENMSSFICGNCGNEHFLFGQGGVERAVEELGVNFLGKIPLELELREGSDSGVPYMSREDYQGRPVWNAFLEVARKVESHFSPPAPSEKNGGIMAKLFGLGR